MTIDGPEPTPRRRPSWLVLGLAVVLAVAVSGSVATSVARAHTAPQWSFIAAAQGEHPTVTAWYADGSNGDASPALAGPWRPAKTIRMLTVAAEQSCSITVDEVLSVIEQAPVNRLAMCVWVAPTG